MKRLYRSRQNKMIGGVCAGLGEYLDLDPTLIRLVMIIAVFGAGAGVLAYLVAWVLIPNEPY
ncbi:PspC domain-containing protein [Desulfitobacterium metallireducens]|uniref:Phage-shock protein n=1 Tax=Desulfitobacterium metallireducens DSM 15288 TaxID=871968 RepID=W0E7L5_9FIRM|nr:PspC domain-containing protein [Desulfitobacterium metallireducens]AHF06850.1 phage-shock protein [Desulfitobacterium metallireducens DSM 15288]